jgi:hypothetical protein
MGCATASGIESQSRDLTIVDSWSGDFPVAQLELLPDGQRGSQVGYIGDKSIFTAVWQALMPGEMPPTVNFERHLVVFSRNVKFYNRTKIFKVTLSDGGVDVLAMETMSALPIEDRVAMAMAVVPRDGIDFIRSGQIRMPVTR